MKLFTSCWFHDWEFDNFVSIVVPKRGPFDPPTDKARTIEAYRYICVDCGSEKIKKDTPCDFY